MLNNENVQGMKEEGIKYPVDFGKFYSTSIIATFKCMLNNYLALSELSQMLIKRACDFPQFMSVTDRKIQEAHLTTGTLEHHDISHDAVKKS